MFAKKTPKSQKPDSTRYTLHLPDYRPDTERVWREDYYQVVSIDPAIRNFGFRIERRYHSGKIVGLHTERKDFEPKLKKNQPPPENPLECVRYREVTTFLKQFEREYKQSHIFVIERQLPHNYQAVRMSQHIISYLEFTLAGAPLMPYIIEVDSRLKSQQLKCPKGLNERQTKLWLIEKAEELHIARGDQDSLAQLKAAKKKDDIADVVCQIEALFAYLGLPLTPIPEPVVLADGVGSNGDELRKELEALNLTMPPPKLVLMFN